MGARDVRGVTLLEAVVVLGIAATTAALLWRADPLSTRLAVRAAAARLVADLRLAQSQAMGERGGSDAFGIEFPPAGDVYLLTRRASGKVIVVRRQLLPPKVRITYARFGGATPRSILFTGVSLYGAPSGGGTVTLASGAGRMCVRVAPATGRMRVAAAGCP